MALITWSERMSVGVERIDREHRGLIDLLNTLHAGMMSGKGDDVLRGVLDELVRYTKTHFATEESLFRLHGYPQAATHKKEHDELTKRAVELQDAVADGKSLITLPTLSFLKDWLTNHIMKIDMAYKPFFTAKNVR